MNLVIGVTITPGMDMDAFSDAVVKAFHKGLKDIANAAMGEWQDEAGRQLHRTRRNYQSAISTNVVNDEEIEVILHHPDKKINWVVTALEVGVPSYSVKDALLKSPSATKWSQYCKSNPGGPKSGPPFVDVPFRVGAAKEQSKPSYFRRASAAGKAEWKHPGFRPAGGGGLKAPIREHVKEYVEKQADIVFSPIMSRIRL